MNKFRLIPSILFKENTAIRGRNFESWRTVGSLLQTIRLYSLREVDEIIFLDVDAGKNKKINFKLIDEFADECFMPITVGGGIKNIQDIEDTLKVGADRVSINTEAFKNINFIKKAIDKFGSQCIVISVDYKLDDNNKKIVHICSGKKNTGIELKEYLNQLNDIGVGEILLTSINHDGMMKGYDNQTLKEVNEKYDFNLIASGGAGNFEGILETINYCNLKAISCSSIFHFTESTPNSLKEFLKKNKINVRY
tara:strand:+ start:201 stop:956 length:756 start_codon:yes stop_codon:yes gene_type:complete